MAREIEVVQAESAEGLRVALDAFFAAHPAAIFYSLSTLITEDVRTIGLDLAVAVCFDDLAGGNDLTATPITSVVMQGRSAADLATQAAAQVALAPLAWYKGPYIGYLGQSRRASNWVGILLTSSGVLADVDANWAC